jgi:hypothetical protein
LAIASASENDKLSATENTENVRCFIVKMLYTKKKYNTYCLDVVTSISVMIRMIKTTLLINKSSTVFERLYAHRQEVGLRFTAYGFLSCTRKC